MNPNDDATTLVIFDPEGAQALADKVKKLGETFNNAKVIWERADGTFVDADGYDGIISEGVDRLGKRRFRAPKRDVHRSTRGDVKGAGRTRFNVGRTGGGVEKEGFIIWEGETPDNVLRRLSLPGS